MNVVYGPIAVEIERWKWPTESIFKRWKKEFLALDEVKYFDVYLLGGFLEQLKSKKENTPDVDIILVGCDDTAKIKTLIEAGTRIGIEKHNVFFDVLWFDSLPIYANDFSLSHRIQTYLISNKWLVDGKVKKEYPKAQEIEQGLWGMSQVFPTQKQRQRINAGFEYCRPHLISAKSKR